MADWEKAQRIALRQLYPEVDIRGCWFHFNRAIIRRRQKMGIHFHRLLKNDQNALLIYKALQQIPLLPAENIVDGYYSIKNKAETDGLSRGFKQMFTYFESYWLTVVSDETIFLFNKVDNFSAMSIFPNDAKNISFNLSRKHQFIDLLLFCSMNNTV